MPRLRLGQTAGSDFYRNKQGPNHRMRIAYLDCFSGISGDMFLGALVDAGVDPELLRRTVRALDLGAELEISRVNRFGIGATKVNVLVRGVKDEPADVRQNNSEDAPGHSHEHTHQDGTTHAHGHSHSHSFDHHADTHSHQHEHSDGTSHAHGNTHDHGQTHSHNDAHEHDHAHRGLKEIRDIILRTDISAQSKKTALQIFQVLGEAEARIHNKDIEEIHFHEVGAVDAIVDIVCAAVAAEALGVDEWHCSPLNVGSGTVECAHGTLPVPAPATLELLKNAPVYSGDIKKELVTPTGAAIVRTLVKKFGGIPALRVEHTGYGAGERDFTSAANVLRITIGEAARVASAHGPASDEVVVLEANVDDMTPEVFGYVIDRLLEAGALDAFCTPAQMKKNRPGMLLTALVRPADADRLSEVIFAETTTIGLRMRTETRKTLERRFVTVATEWGEVKIKIAEMNGKTINAAPEFDDCRKIAVEHKVALKKVMAEAMRVYQQSAVVTR